MSDEPTTTDDAIVTASDESPTVSAGTAASVTSRTAEGSASYEADASESSSERETTRSRSVRKIREGFVVSQKMNKTVVVAVIERVRHPKYNKFVLQTKRLYAHDESNDVNVGDKVRVMETRPLSKTKRWRVAEILERAK
jgi:small subunit ribosomal protein S17